MTDRVAAEKALHSGLAMDMFVSMATNGSLMWRDLEGEELSAFQLFRELGWVDFVMSTSRFYITEAGVEVVDRAQEAARAVMLSSLVTAAVGEG